MKRWEWELENSIKSLEDLKKYVKLSAKEEKKLAKVINVFPMQITPHYLKLINWKDPKDPIRRLVIPRLDELKEEGFLDPSNEKSITVMRGLEHKYSPTALDLISDECASYCRFCFRKRLREGHPDFGKHSVDVIRNKKHLKKSLDYIKKHKEIDNVLLSGGDPATLSNEWLEHIFRELRKIDHVRIIRFGTRCPAYLPYRVTSDPQFLKIIKKYNKPDKRIYFVLHFEHPKELTKETIKCLKMLEESGVILKNQTVLTKGVNDNPKTIRELFNKLAYLGVPPYYLFQCRPVISSKHLRVPLKRGYKIFEEAKKGMSGLAKTARYAMSHSTGKLEIVGLKGDVIYLKYHQAKDPKNIGKFFSMKVKETDLWFDDLTEHVTKALYT